MNALVVYESFFHNTEAIARVIGAGLEQSMETKVAQFEDVKPGDLQNLDLLVVGSPTQRFGPTEEIMKFLRKLPAGALIGIPVAVFDTRLEPASIQNGFVRFMVSIGGYAGSKLMKTLVSLGAKKLGEPEGFWVTGQEGPLKDGELDRASQWGETLAKLVRK